MTGRLFEAGVYIIQGSPGAGKTILANQICFHQVARQRRAVYYTLLTEAHDRMMAFLQPLRFFDPAAIPDGVSYVSGFQILEAQGLAGVGRLRFDNKTSAVDTYLRVIFLYQYTGYRGCDVGIDWGLYVPDLRRVRFCRRGNWNDRASSIWIL